MAVPLILVVSLARAALRRDRMIARLERQGLDYRIVDAVDRETADVDRYEPGPGSQERAVAACLGSHMKALRTGLETRDPSFIVVEDDVRLIRGFSDRWSELARDVPSEAPLVSLSYLVWSWEGFVWSGMSPEKENLTTMGADLWGTQMYFVRRAWAARCVERFDRPLAQIETSDLRTSELVVRSARFEGGLVAYPPLALEELSGSLLVPEAGDSNHAEGLRWWANGDYGH